MSRRPKQDRDSEPWWLALDRGKLLVQTCEDCDTKRWPPRAMCNRCGSFKWSWQDSRGGATVASWVVTHHGFDPTQDVPHLTILGRLNIQQDILIPGSCNLADGERISVGAGLMASFVKRSFDDGPLTILEWNFRSGPGEAD